jgi:flavin reductase (DIM6/NTAB) family NADH-FMN oxidoreductase RutF
MVHSENPFLPEPGERDPARRFRGRLAGGVTIVTSGSGANRTGLTVSSLLVVEGEPAVAHLLVGPSTDLWSTAADTGRFVVQLCGFEHRRLADVFAGLAPSPGGMFAGADLVESDWGTLLTDLPDRLYCSYVTREETGWSGVMVGTVDHVEVSELADPLVHYRGRYRRLADPADLR